MKQLKTMALLLCAALAVSVSGCGSDNREGSTPAQVQASQSCLGCHNGTLSRVTGNSVAQDWLRSAHASASGGASCDDCHHATQFGHPQNGAIPPLPTDLECVRCHTNTVAMRTQMAHFANLSASYLGFPLSRLSITLVNPVNTIANQGTETARSWSSCNGCHNPHDVTTLLPVNRQWASSGHGDTRSETFNEDPFMKFSGGACNRCHTATGFRYYMTVGAQRVITPALLGAYSSAKEVISCNACHTDYSWRRLSSDPRVAFQVYSTPYVRFDAISKRIPSTTVASTLANIGDSQLCVPCHAGRTGARAGAAITMVRTANIFDSHYFPAAATMYGKIGFINFSTASALSGPYGRSLITSEDVAGGVTSVHRRLGTASINGFSANFTPGVLDANGPCVVCHMTAGHNLNFNDPTFATNTYNQVCSNCHSQENGQAITAANFLTGFVEENRQQFLDALALATRILETRYDITTNLTDEEALETPQDVTFVRASSPTTALSSAPNWTAYVTTGPGATLSDLQVYKLKGALFNIALAYKEPASYIHARTLTRRLIYDSIDFLDDKIMNLSVGTTAQTESGVGSASTNRVFGLFTRGATAYAGNIETSPLAAGTSPSMPYLLGFNRTTGAWNTVERP